ncbi:hypothetical protein CYMTET_55581 [Cymbomonas tetramitiformis]|uniref:Uncharacterized protein n=1 Tax=Cymbomonas tetramitiformis TaxID=36881 RepID=A0AAE0BD09_9CHLO|nr:hypothetical protein CYMTET_55581 [Cymbomonas tetramitiformis]
MIFQRTSLAEQSSARLQNFEMNESPLKRRRTSSDLIASAANIRGRNSPVQVTYPSRLGHLRTLHEAAGAGDIDVLRTLIASGANVNASEVHPHTLPFSLLTDLLHVSSQNLCTPLLLAAVGDHFEVVCALLATGLVHNVNPRDANGTPALFWAVQNGALEIARTLIVHGASAHDTAQENNWTALHEASRQGRADLAELLLQHGAMVTELDSSDGRSPMHIALSQDDIAMVRVLASRGGIHMDMNEARQARHTALHFAACMGRTGAARCLLHAGADVEAHDVEWNTPLHFAARVGHAEMLRILLGSGADVGARNQGDHTALHFAAHAGCVEVANHLLAGGSSKNARNVYGCTPLHFATRAGNAEVVECLLLADADKDARDVGRHTPLHFAAHAGHADAVQCLLDAGANKEARDVYGCSPLHFAARGGHTAVIICLLQAGADVEARGMGRHTPLHFAVHAGRVEAVQQLLKAGANTEAGNLERHNPLHFAARAGRVDLVQHLLHAGADAEAHDQKKLTPLHFAVCEGHLEAVEQLLRASPMSRHDLNGYYRRFVHHFSEIAKPLTELTKSDVPWQWGEQQQWAFNELKAALTSSPVLALPDVKAAADGTAPFLVQTDASGVALGGVLMQDTGEGMRVVAYDSRQFSAAEQNYHTEERELRQARWYMDLMEVGVPRMEYVIGALLVVPDALSRRSDYVVKSPREWLAEAGVLPDKETDLPVGMGAKLNAVSVMTEHGSTPPAPAPIWLATVESWEEKVLTLQAAEQALDVAYACVEPEQQQPQQQQGQQQQAQMVKVRREVFERPQRQFGEFDVDACCEPGGHNRLIDQYWTKCLDEKWSDSTFVEALRDEYARKGPLRKLREEVRTAPHQAAREFRIEGDVRWRVVAAGRYQLVLGEDSPLREVIFWEAHDSVAAGHTGRDKTLERALRRFWWKNATNDVAEWVASCPTCQAVRPRVAYPDGLLNPHSIPLRNWQEVEVDFVTGLPLTERGNDAFVAFTCKLRKMVHMVHMPFGDSSAQTVARIYFDTVWRQPHGAPTNIDRVRQGLEVPRCLLEGAREADGGAGGLHNTIQPAIGWTGGAHEQDD